MRHAPILNFRRPMGAVPALTFTAADLRDIDELLTAFDEDAPEAVALNVQREQCLEVARKKQAHTVVRLFDQGFQMFRVGDTPRIVRVVSVDKRRGTAVIVGRRGKRDSVALCELYPVAKSIR